MVLRMIWNRQKIPIRAFCCAIAWSENASCVSSKSNQKVLGFRSSSSLSTTSEPGTICDAWSEFLCHRSLEDLSGFWNWPRGHDHLFEFMIYLCFGVTQLSRTCNRLRKGFDDIPVAYVSTIGLPEVFCPSRQRKICILRKLSALSSSSCAPCEVEQHCTSVDACKSW